PESKGPEGRHRTTAGQRGVFRENVFWLAEEDEEIEVLVARIDHVVRVVEFADVEGQRRARVYKHAVPVTAQKEWDGLVHEFVLRAHAVARRDQNFLPTLVEARKRF